MGERAVVGDLRVEREARGTRDVVRRMMNTVGWWWGLLSTTSRVRIRGVERRVLCLCACLDREREVVGCTELHRCEVV